MHACREYDEDVLIRGKVHWVFVALPTSVSLDSIDSSSIEGSGLSVADMKQILMDLGERTVLLCLCLNIYIINLNSLKSGHT